ncbi:MAG: phosphoribosylaminoimidazolesuccinocarboxamide synthase, partial [Methanobrevibacter sp.]|nr:phosphoribosylaminoimidazolesuccinocarboxamide synthase [Methanobrevibacter sp.]
MMKKELINGGKVKSVYTTDNDEEVIIEFRDDITAGDGARKEVMNKKGAYNAIISAKIFKVLEESGVATQFIDLPKPNVMLAKRLEMIPIEVIVRNIATGSLVRKYPIAEGTRLEPPIVQMDFKDDEYHDPMLNDSLIKALGIATQEEIDILTEKALKI